MEDLDSALDVFLAFPLEVSLVEALPEVAASADPFEAVVLDTPFFAFPSAFFSSEELFFLVLPFDTLLVSLAFALESPFLAPFPEFMAMPTKVGAVEESLVPFLPEGSLAFLARGRSPTPAEDGVERAVTTRSTKKRLLNG